MDYLTKADLIFLLEEIQDREHRRNESIKKYHSTDKGKLARKRATDKYYSKLQTEVYNCTLCNKSVKMTCKYSHLRSKKHKGLLSNSP